jgi:hypothetical protein
VPANGEDQSVVVENMVGSQKDSKTISAHDLLNTGMVLFLERQGSAEAV